MNLYATKNNALRSLLIGSSLLVQLTAHADLLGYEGFNYPAGTSLASLNGGVGWNGGWVNVSGGGTVNAGSLISGSNAPAGYDGRSAGNSAFIGNGNRSGRLLDCSAAGAFGSHGYIDANGHIGADGKTLYLGFLQQATDTVKFYEFEFHQGDLGDPGRIGGIGNDFNSTTVNFRAPDSVQTPLATPMLIFTWCELISSPATMTSMFTVTRREIRRPITNRRSPCPASPTCPLTEFLWPHLSMMSP
jgi:hypothetical protein